MAWRRRVTGNSGRVSDLAGNATQAKAAVNAPQSRRFAKFEERLALAKRLECVCL